MDEIVYSLWLAAKTGIRPAVKCSLFETFQSFRKIYEASEEELKKTRGIRPSDLRSLSDKNIARAEELSVRCKKEGISVICIDDPAYPERLKNIYDPPLTLFVKGKLPDIDSLPVISVIGTRRADEYGLKVSSDIAYEISLCGGVVVSGLTSGADAASAEGALASGRPMIAVLGTSHDKCTSALSKKVLRNGALISEYPPGTDANKSFFRARNRIAAGISVGVVVTQAPEKSGTRLFASEAAEQGKDIFVIPGNVDSENSAGIYELMHDGAQPVVSGRDVLREYVRLFPDQINLHGASGTEKPKVSAKAGPRTVSRSRREKAAPLPAQESRSATDRLKGLDEKQRPVAESLLEGPKFAEEIMYATGIPVSSLFSMLTLLEIKGIVKRTEDGRYKLNN